MRDSNGIYGINKCYVKKIETYWAEIEDTRLFLHFIGKKEEKKANINYQHFYYVWHIGNSNENITWFVFPI